MTNSHLSQRELARRLGISPRTLEGWRWRGTGPCFVKAGGRVLYRLEDVEAYESQRLRQRTSRAAPAACATPD
jgi:predicted site-specific integrase-resolvase